MKEITPLIKARLLLPGVVAFALGVTSTASALNINLTYDPDSTFAAAGLTAADIVNMKSAAAYAALQFTSRYRDPIDVNIKVTAVAGTGTLGMSSTPIFSTTYASLRPAFVSDSKTADDATALGANGSLPAADPIGTTHLYVVTRAQRKALGLAVNDLTNDGTFTFGGGFSYTYDPFGRVAAGKIDFIGVAMHEFSEIMGRIGIMGQNIFGQADYMAFDLFHFTGAGTRGLTNGAGRFFSIDNGSTLLKGFNNAATNGGDLQDWASGVNDTFNAFSNSGVLNDLTTVDIRNMDAIGYDLFQPLCTETLEDFDGVVAPALPAGWVAANATGAAPLWITSATTPLSPANCAFVDDPATVTNKHLDTPGIFITSSSVRLAFSHSFALEASGGFFFDGGVLEVASPNINNGAFTDITNAAVGGSFVSGGYTGTIDGSHANPLAGRMAWSGNSGGYVNVVVDPGPNVVGRTVQFRFRMGSDNSTASGGWRVDNFAVHETACSLTSAVSRKPHTGVGNFDINLPFDAVTLLSSLGIESRSGGATNVYQVVHTFPVNTSFVTATLSAGAGAVSSSTGSGTTAITVNLTGVTDIQKVLVHLSGVTVGAKTGDLEVPLGILIGDANGDGFVNSADATLTRNLSGKTTDGTNFRSDFNTTGDINSADATIVRARSGNTIP